MMMDRRSLLRYAAMVPLLGVAPRLARAAGDTAIGIALVGFVLLTVWPFDAACLGTKTFFANPQRRR